MIPQKIIIAVFALFVTSLFACFSLNNKSREVKAARRVEKGGTEKMPSFTVQNFAGETLSLDSMKGKKVFINLWATWCPPCRKEIPSIEKLYNRVDKEKTVFIMLSLDESFDAVKKFAASNALQLPIYFPAENLPGLFNVQGIPATFIFNEQGELVKQINGMDNYYTKEYIEIFK